MSRPITWQQVAAPDFRAANQLVQQGSENITGAIAQVGDIGEQQSNAVIDRNVASLAQEIMSVGSGIEGLQNIANFEQDLASLDASAIGGTENLNRISSAIMGKRDQLESEAIGSFQDLLVEAEATGDFDAVRAASSEFGSMVRSSAPVLEEARSREATYNANMLQQGLASGEMTVEQVMANPDVNLGQPEYANVLAMAAQQANNERMGGLMRQIPSFIEAVTTGGQTPDKIREQVMSGFTDRELAENAQNIFGLMSQVDAAYSASLDLTESEKSIVDLQRQRLDRNIELAEQEINNTAERMAERVGLSLNAINVMEQARDSNLNMSEYIDKALGGGMSVGDRRKALAQINRQRGDAPIEAIAYAIDMHGKLGRRWFADDSGFAKLIEEGKAKTNDIFAVSTAIKEFKLGESRRLLDYEMEGLSSVNSNQQSLINGRRSSTPPQMRSIAPFVSYDQRQSQQMREALLSQDSVESTTQRSTTSTNTISQTEPSSFVQGFQSGREGELLNVLDDRSNMTPLQAIAASLGGVGGGINYAFDQTLAKPAGSVLKDISEFLTTTPNQRKARSQPERPKTKEQKEREEFAALIRKLSKEANERSN